MQERITFIVDARDALDERSLSVHDDLLQIAGLNAAREDQFTFGLQELPNEVWQALNRSHELHIRWSSGDPYSSTSPFDSRVSPGLHVFFTPHLNKPAYDGAAAFETYSYKHRGSICALLIKAFSEALPCFSPKTSFTPINVLSERFASSATYHFYHSLPSLDAFHEYIVHIVCRGNKAQSSIRKAQGLSSANQLDIDFDSISQTLKIRIYRGNTTWHEDISQFGAAKTEVGILAQQTSTEAEKQSFEGYLVELGRDEKLKSTQFSFPARHHPPPQSKNLAFSASLTEPSGLHPTLRLSFQASPAAPVPNSCALHTFLTLPSFIFIDKYQLDDPLYLASKNLEKAHIVYGETDLEAPDWAVERWGSAVLLELAMPTQADVWRGTWHADVPLHLRYLAPAPSGSRSVEMPWPVVFWACRAEEGTKMNVSPFDRNNLGYDGLFGPKTMFYHVPPAANSSRGLLQKLEVPVLDENRTAWAGAYTVSVLLIGLYWVIRTMTFLSWPGSQASGTASNSNKKRQ